MTDQQKVERNLSTRADVFSGPAIGKTTAYKLIHKLDTFELFFFEREVDCASCYS